MNPIITAFNHGQYHFVWTPKYKYKILTAASVKSFSEHLHLLQHAVMHGCGVKCARRSCLVSENAIWFECLRATEICERVKSYQVVCEFSLSSYGESFLGKGICVDIGRCKRKNNTTVNPSTQRLQKGLIRGYLFLKGIVLGGSGKLTFSKK